MAEFYKLFVNSLIAGIALFSVMAFVVSFQSTNNVSNSLVNNPLISHTYGNLSNKLGGLSEDTQDQRTRFESENPTAQFGEIIFDTISSGGIIFGGLTVSLFNAIIGLPQTVLGIPKPVIAVLSAILIVTIILGLWRIYKAGG